jgi:glutamate/tyrosine decarboxylase-like PLP-dependent enzyme
MALAPDADPAQVHDMARQSLAVVERYFAEMSTAPIIQLPTAADVRSAFAEPLPRHATPFPEALATVRDVIYPLSRHDGHPRFFGYVASPGSAVATMGDLLTAALNANVTSWRSAPAPAEIEHLVIEWIKTAIGFPASGAGQLVSGGSMANFSGLAAARSAKAPDFTRTGDFGPRKPRLYISREGHFSNHKAARLLGYGVENVRTVAVDARFRMDLRDLERQIRADAAAGYAPACVVANAGTTNTGAIDPLAGVADIARRYGMWMHVDGAYGGFARLAPSARSRSGCNSRCTAPTRSPPPWSATWRARGVWRSLWRRRPIWSCWRRWSFPWSASATGRRDSRASWTRSTSACWWSCSAAAAATSPIPASTAPSPCAPAFSTIARPRAI